MPSALPLTRDQFVGAKFHAEKITESIQSILLLEEITGNNPDVVFLRGHALKNFRLHLRGMAQELGYRLEPLSQEEERAA